MELIEETPPTQVRFPAISEFVPARWLPGGHLQTIFGAYLPSRLAPYRATPHFLQCDDGDQIVVHDDVPSTWRKGDRCVVMLHGVCGCHASPYMVRLAAKLHELGIRTFRMDQRGVGSGVGLARYPANAGRSGDVATALRFIVELCPTSTISLVGFSLGGNVILKMLGETTTEFSGIVDRAIAVAPPIDLTRCSENLERGLNWLYSKRFAKELRTAVRNWPTEARSPKVSPLTARSLIEFDEQFTAPMSGFRDAADYYQRSGATLVLRHVRIPTLILAASDDPLIPIRIFDDAVVSDSVRIVTTRGGGHLGYIGRSGRDPNHRWLDWRLVELLR